MGSWLGFYNQERQHQSLGSRTPRQAYEAVCPWIDAPVGGSILSQTAYFGKSEPARHIEERSGHHQPNSPAPLIATLLLSLALWVGIWGVTALVSIEL
jgi:hypothetical protein